MVPEETSRRRLHEAAVGALGAEAADVLMEHLPPAGWADLARRSDVEHETALLRLEIGTLREEMRGEIGTVRAEMRGEFSAVRGEFATVRAEMAALGERLQKEMHSGLASQTRLMATLMLALGALFTTVDVLGR